MRIKAFFRRHRETILFGYLTFITLIAIVLACYCVIISTIAEDLAQVVQIREQQISEMAFDMSYQSALNEKIGKELDECKSKLGEE